MLISAKVSARNKRAIARSLSFRTMSVIVTALRSLWPPYQAVQPRKANYPLNYYIGTECGLEQPSIVLLEQLRTIDKRRLNNFVGRLSAGQITEMNHALAISIDLIDSIPKKLILCLCNTCADKFCGMGVFDLRKVESPQENHGACANCNRRDGFNYEVIPKGR